MQQSYEEERRHHSFLQPRKFMKIAKAEFKENFAEEDIIYVAILSHTGGEIKVKAAFQEKRAEFSAETTNDEPTKVAEQRITSPTSDSDSRLGSPEAKRTIS